MAKKTKKQPDYVLMTRPDGNPADIPADQVESKKKLGFKIGYKPDKEETK